MIMPIRTYKKQYKEVQNLLSGKSIPEIAKLVETDNRFSFGMYNPYNTNDGYLDVNYKDILVTIKDGALLPNFECYDNNGIFITHINFNK